METGPDLKSAQWRKSSYSGSTGGECVECTVTGGATWRKSSYSGNTGGECVEVAKVAVPRPGIVWVIAGAAARTGIAGLIRRNERRRRARERHLQGFFIEMPRLHNDQIYTYQAM